MIDSTTKIQDALLLAIQKEKSAYEFYKKASEVVKDPGVRKMFAFFAEEELKHVKLLEDEYDKNILQEM